MNKPDVLYINYMEKNRWIRAFSKTLALSETQTGFERGSPIPFSTTITVILSALTEDENFVPRRRNPTVLRCRCRWFCYTCTWSDGQQTPSEQQRLIGLKKRLFFFFYFNFPLVLVKLRPD